MGRPPVDGGLSDIPLLGEIKLIRDPGFGILNGLALVALLAVVTVAGCGDDFHRVDSNPPQPVDQKTLEDTAAELEGRSFRQFHPSRNASPRSGVILDFRNGFRLWAQYAEDGHAVYEWEVTADSYRIESAGEPSEFVLFPESVRSEQQFPDPCLDCVPAAGVSISVRHVMDADEIAFRINDPDNVLPQPFPVFDSWTRFREDEVFY